LGGGRLGKQTARRANYLGRLVSQDADNATLHWALEPVRRPKAGTGHGSAGRRPSQHDTSTKRHSNGPSHHYGGDDIGDCSDLWRQRWRQRLNNDIIRTQDADNATLHWDWNPVRRPKAVTGHGSAGRRPSLACTGHGSAGRRPPAEGRRWRGRRPGTAARAVCARRSEQCAVYGARLSSMRTLYVSLQN